MKLFSTLLASTALFGLIAAPAMALTLDLDTGIAVDTGVGVAVDGTVDGAATAEVPMTTVADSTFIGNPVVTSDAVSVGTVTSVNVDPEGNQQVVVSLSGDIATEATTFSLMLPPTATSDGEVTLGWTQAEFEAALAAQIAG